MLKLVAKTVLVVAGSIIVIGVTAAATVAIGETRAKDLAAKDAK